MRGEYTVGCNCKRSMYLTVWLVQQAKAALVCLIMQWIMENVSQREAKEYSPEFEIGTYLW